MAQSTGATPSKNSTSALQAAQADLQATSDRFVNAGDLTYAQRAALVQDLRIKAAIVDTIERGQR